MLGQHVGPDMLGLHSMPVHHRPREPCHCLEDTFKTYYGGEAVNGDGDDTSAGQEVRSLPLLKLYAPQEIVLA
jgi:hypothetical protein